MLPRCFPCLCRVILIKRILQYSVFEHLHKNEIKRAKDEGILTASQLETIVHPNEYFKRGYLLKHMDAKEEVKDEDVKMTEG